MKPVSRTILSARVTYEKKTHQWPVAVFSTPEDAKQYAVFLHLAHTAGDAGRAKSLDPRTLFDADGNLVKGVAYSIVTVPYAPSAGASGLAGFEIEEPATV